MPDDSCSRICKWPTGASDSARLRATHAWTGSPFLSVRRPFTTPRSFLPVRRTKGQLTSSQSSTGSSGGPSAGGDSRCDSITSATTPGAASASSGRVGGCSPQDGDFEGTINPRASHMLSQVSVRRTVDGGVAWHVVSTSRCARTLALRNWLSYCRWCCWCVLWLLSLLVLLLLLVLVLVVLLLLSLLLLLLPPLPLLLLFLLQVLFPAFRAHLLPPAQWLNTHVFMEVACLQKLYRIFERC
jgi:hypothetical protein